MSCSLFFKQLIGYLTKFTPTMENSKVQQKLHAVFVPLPLQGHVIPSINLAIKLASKGLTISFINTESIHQQISKANPDRVTDDDIFGDARRSGLDIRYYTISDGLPLDFDRSLNHDQFNASLLHVYSAHVESLLKKIAPSSDPPIACLIADAFYVWPNAVAKKFNLFHAAFWVSQALSFVLYYHMDLLRKRGHFGSHEIIDYIPGVVGIKQADLPSYLQQTDVLTIIHQVIFQAFKEIKKADFVLCNTVQELESDTVAALQAETPFYAVGPILPFGFKKSKVPTSLLPSSDCTKWLDSKPNESVLYVSFGSLAHLTKDDLYEIANGLLLSQVNFVWVLRPDLVSFDGQDPLPDKFVDQCGDRGLIVPWCNQIEVLSHPAIGGFFTHCGWNSTLESIWCKVPFLGFPFFTDHFTIRKLIIDDWKLGVDINPKKPVTRELVSQKVNDLMSGNLRDGFKMKIEEVKKTLQNAMEADGSTEKNIEVFIEDLTARIHDPCGVMKSLQD